MILPAQLRKTILTISNAEDKIDETTASVMEDWTWQKLNHNWARRNIFLQITFYVMESFSGFLLCLSTSFLASLINCNRRGNRSALHKY